MIFFRILVRSNKPTPMDIIEGLICNGFCVSVVFVVQVRRISGNKSKVYITGSNTKNTIIMFCLIITA